eukprot:15442886-Alexandrium_andersonii.AAC.1
MEQSFFFRIVDPTPASSKRAVSLAWQDISTDEVAITLHPARQHGRELTVSLDPVSSKDGNGMPHSVCCWSLPHDMPHAELRTFVAEWKGTGDVEFRPFDCLPHVAPCCA